MNQLFQTKTGSNYFLAFILSNEWRIFHSFDFIKKHSPNFSKFTQNLLQSINKIHLFISSKSYPNNIEKNENDFVKIGKIPSSIYNLYLDKKRLKCICFRPNFVNSYCSSSSSKASFVRDIFTKYFGLNWKNYWLRHTHL